MVGLLSGCLSDSDDNESPTYLVEDSGDKYGLELCDESGIKNFYAEGVYIKEFQAQPGASVESIEVRSVREQEYDDFPRCIRTEFDKERTFKSFEDLGNFPLKKIIFRAIDRYSNLLEDEIVIGELK